ncbi:tetratricopeptide repeat protein [Malaciobacter marinus]|uniref:Tetratricopeptide repeat protein n=3 Tax=Malaciobacter marinus TaxID=505249 RepID=A0A347TLQ0_9BACT|nr:tetratricopeptide repeat protein [Malaciobacter marinus]AXX87528.1 tetratricopeptide repeat protein [Malaciobacter marinus]
MKVKTIINILIIAIISLNLTACEDNKSSNNTKEKEIKFTPSLPMPDVKEEYINKYFKLSQLSNAKKDPVPAMKIGYAYSEKLHDYEKALEWYKYADSMIALGENSYFACYALQKLKRYDEAISWCKKAIDLKWDKALFRIGDIYKELNDYDKAVFYYKQSFEKTKDKMSANNLGFIFSKKLNNYQKAEKWYKEAIKLNNYESYKNISSLYHEKLKNDIKASAYAIAVIDTKYTKASVLRVLQNDMKIPNDIIQKGYELQLNSDEFPIKYKGKLDLDE